AAEQAQEIIDFHTEEFMGWLRSLDAVGMIQDYRRQAEDMRNEALDRALKQLNNGKPAEEVLQFLAHTITNKLLHTPSTQIRQAGFDGHIELLEAANTLFQIKDGDGSK
ncbi:MAG: glutamyl-tRNA reductase, partial [Sedimenticola sp.]